MRVSWFHCAFYKLRSTSESKMKKKGKNSAYLVKKQVIGTHRATRCCFSSTGICTARSEECSWSDYALTRSGGINSVSTLRNASAVVSTHEPIGAPANRVGQIVAIGIAGRTSTIAHMAVVVMA